MTEKYLLALDISTSCTGWSLWNIKTKELFKAGAIETPSDKPDKKTPPRFPDLFSKVTYLYEELSNVVCNGLDIEYVAVEQALKKLSGGSSNADTIGMLIQFNFCIMYLLTQKLKCKYLYLDVKSARKSVGITVPRKADAKECVKLVMQPRYPNLSYPLTRTGSLKKFCYDMMDSLVIGESAIKNV